MLYFIITLKKYDQDSRTDGSGIKDQTAAVQSPIYILLFINRDKILTGYDNQLIDNKLQLTDID